MHVENLILKAWKDWNEENVYSYEFHNSNNSIIASISDEEYISIVGLSKYKKFEYTVETADYHHIFNLLTR